MTKTYAPSTNFVENSQLTTEKYQELYQQSITDPESFWAEQAQKYITWKKP